MYHFYTNETKNEHISYIIKSKCSTKCHFIHTTTSLHRGVCIHNRFETTTGYQHTNYEVFKIHIFFSYHGNLINSYWSSTFGLLAFEDFSFNNVISFLIIRNM